MTEAPEPGFRDGPVMCKGQGIKKWKKTWVVVKSGLCQYFDTEDFPGATPPLDTLRLKRAKLRKLDKKETHKNDFGFAVVYRTGKDKKEKELFIALSTEKEQSKWIRSFSESIAIANPNVFGVDLRIAVMKAQDQVPAVVSACVDALRSKHMDVEGLFRVSGSSKEIKKVREAIDDGGAVDLRKVEPHVISGLLKQYLRELPDPLLTYALHREFLDAGRRSTAEQVKAVRSLTAALPVDHLNTLSFLLKFLNELSKHEDLNKMTTLNLATVFGPTILWGPDEANHDDHSSSDLSINVTNTMISHWEACLGLADVPLDLSSPRGGAAASTSDEKPKGAAGGQWKEYKTKEGKTYFHNKSTGETVWKRPAEMADDDVPPAPASDDEEEEVPHHTGPQFALGGADPRAMLGQLKKKKEAEDDYARKAEQAREEAAARAARNAGGGGGGGGSGGGGGAQAGAGGFRPPLRGGGAPVPTRHTGAANMTVNGRLAALESAIAAIEDKQAKNVDLLQKIIDKLQG